MANNQVSARIFKIAFMRLMSAVIYFSPWFRLEDPKRPSEAVGMVGVIVCTCGIGLVASDAGEELERLSAIETRPSTGAERPLQMGQASSYSGMVLGLLGSALTVGTRVGFGVVAFCFIGLFAKSRKEEALLTRQIPGYAEFKRRVKAFVPYALQRGALCSFVACWCDGQHQGMTEF